MGDSGLSLWRDVAIVLLAIETAFVIAVPGVALYFAIRGVRAVKRRITMPLLTARLWAMRIQNATLRASHAAIALPIAAQAVQARVRATAHGVAGWLKMS